MRVGVISLLRGTYLGRVDWVFADLDVATLSQQRLSRRVSSSIDISRAGRMPIPNMEDTGK
jgi:hypothetical protein